MAKKSSGQPGNNLVVVESPAKARTIEQYLGEGFTVLASMGHVRDLPKKDLGVDLEGGTYEPKYVSIRAKTKVMSALKKAAENADTIYLATDHDREGEAIAWHVAVLLGEKDPVGNPRFRRLIFNEITRSAVTQALENASEIDWNKVRAQKARRVLDRIVGYQVSPLLWKALYRGLSAGRVQSVALRLICERENEVEAFVPKEYWTLEALFETAVEGGRARYEATLDKVDGKSLEAGSEAEADELVAAARGQDYSIAGVEKKKRKRNPAPPFITSTLQQEAARKLGFSARKTMSVAQQLYEGIEIPGEGSIGLITYMRTDSVRVAAGAVKTAREVISAEYGSDHLPEKPKVYRSRKGAQDAHEAIRPTDPARLTSTTSAYLDRDQQRLFELIWKRFVASQMNAAEFAATTVLTKGGQFQFKSTGSVLTFPGFLALYIEGKDEENGSEEGEKELPAGLTQGAEAVMEELAGEQHFTKPPPRFTEASLVKELEQNGIGRPSTYAQIISVLLDRQYVERERKSLLPTDLGRQVSELLVDLFPDVFQVEFTAKMEDELDKLETGQDEYVKVLSAFYEPFHRSLEEAGARLEEIKQNLQEETGEACEKCGEPMVIKWGRRGRFMACSGYPECKNTRSLEEEEEESVPVDVKCPECESEMVVKNGRYGKFLACSRYPECKGTRPFLIGVDCPECGEPMSEKRTKKGRIFFGCSNYPKCDFASWDPPVQKKCPVCEYSILVEKGAKSGTPHYSCPKCKSVLDPESL